MSALLRRRRAETARVEAFLSAIKATARPVPPLPELVPSPRVPLEPETTALPMHLVTLLVSPR